MSSSHTGLKESKIETQQITIFHVAQAHKPLSYQRYVIESLESERGKIAFLQLREKVAFSQFNVARTIIANPEAILLDEGLTADIAWSLADDGQWFILPNEKLSKALDDATKAFPDGFPTKFDDLTSQQKDCLIHHGTSITLFCLGIIKKLFKTDTEEQNLNSVECYKKNESFLKLSRFVPFYSPLRKGTELHYETIVRRETAAINYAIQAAISSKISNCVVLIIYGADHRHFDETFKQIKPLSNISYGGVIQTYYDSNMNLKKLSARLLPHGVRISPENDYSISKSEVREIIDRYRNIYPSTSVFSTGYSSAAMQALNTFVDTVAKEKVCFQDILQILVKHDISRAHLFISGCEKKAHLTATNRVIIDLHNAFHKAFIPAKDVANRPSLL